VCAAVATTHFALEFMMHTEGWPLWKSTVVNVTGNMIPVRLMVAMTACVVCCQQTWRVIHNAVSFFVLATRSAAFHYSSHYDHAMEHTDTHTLLGKKRTLLFA